jgi:hypothetical protein
MVVSRALPQRPKVITGRAAIEGEDGDGRTKGAIMLATHPDEIAVQILMAALSTFVTQAIAELDKDNVERVQAALATGKLRLTIEMPPLAIRASAVDGLDDSFLFAVRDDRKLWANWARDLAQRSQ